MLNIVERCYIGSRGKTEWKDRLKEMVPSYGENLADNPELLRSIRERTLKVLQLAEADQTAETA